MTLTLLAGGFLLTYWLVLSPMRRFAREKARRDFYEGYRLIELRAVRRYYGALQRIPVHEIEERFNLHRLYNHIGKR